MRNPIPLMFSASALRLVGAALFSKQRSVRPKKGASKPPNPFEGISVFGFKKAAPQDRRDIQELRSLAETPSTDDELDRLLRFPVPALFYLSGLAFWDVALNLLHSFSLESVAKAKT